MDGLAGVEPDRIGLEGLGALLARERDRAIEQRASHAAPARRGRDGEADDRPDGPVVDLGMTFE